MNSRHRLTVYRLGSEHDVHCFGSACEDRSQLLAIDRLGDDGAAVPDEPREVFERDSIL
jgi:hypothetical protein